MALVGSFPFNSFLSGVLSCIGTAVLAGDHFNVSFNIHKFPPFYLFVVKRLAWECLDYEITI